jgi:hypothetical protein
MSHRTNRAVFPERVEPNADRLMQRVRQLEGFRNDTERLICALYDRLKAVEDANALDAKPGSLRLRA